MTVKVRQFTEADRFQLIGLWERCELTRPWNNPSLDIDRKVSHSPDGLLVASIDNEIVGSVMVGYDGHRGWVNYLAADPKQQGKGIGRRLMEAAVAYLEPLGCPKVNFQIRTSNTEARSFYEKIGYSLDDCISMGLRLIPDD